MEDLKEQLASWIDEAIEYPDDRDGIVQDLYDYVQEILETTEDQAFIKGAKSALWASRGARKVG